MPRAVFFSMGGGLGHLNRSLAVIRQLRRSAPHTEPLVLTNSPFCHLALSAGVPVLRLPGSFEQELIGQNDLTSTISAVVLDTLGPADVLLVDALPDQVDAALLRAMRPGKYLKVFVYRHEVPAFDHDLLEAFDLVFYPFPAHLAPAGLPDRFTPCGYILGRQAQDVLTRPQARLRLGLAPDREEPVILAFHACSPAETMALFRQVKGASDALGLGHSLRLSTPQVLPGVEYFYPHLVSLYPVMDVFAAADLVVCAAGYNAFAEVSLLGVKTIFRPIERAKGRQHERITGFPSFEASTSDAALASLMREVIESPWRREKSSPADYHGAEAIAEAIANAIALV